jgi:hypothetical protein
MGVLQWVASGKVSLMSRLLPLLAVQAESRFPADAVAQLRRDLLELLEEFPETRLVVYPEYHCCRVEGGPKQRADEYDAMAEPLDGARVTALRELASEAGVCSPPVMVAVHSAEYRCHPNGLHANDTLSWQRSGHLDSGFRFLQCECWLRK